MSRHRLAAALPSLVLALVAAGYVWASMAYDTASRAMPWIAGVMATALALIDIASTRPPPDGRAHPDPARVPRSPSREAVIFGWIGGFLGLVIVLGFYASIPLYVFCYLKLHARKSAAVSVLTAFGLVGFLYVVFEVLMGYEIFGGLAGGDRM